MISKKDHPQPLLPLTVIVDMVVVPVRAVHPRAEKHGEYVPEVQQKLSGDRLARTYRNFSITAVRTSADGRDFTEVDIQFEVIAHGWCTLGLNTGVAFAVFKGNQQLEYVHSGQMTPFDHPHTWYTINKRIEIQNHSFVAMDRFASIALSDTVVAC